MKASRSIWRTSFWGSLLCVWLFSTLPLTAQVNVDPGCQNYQAWTMQVNPRSDATGINNHSFPDFNVTYWVTAMNFPLGTVITIKGQYPKARYMSLHVYNRSSAILSSINDENIDPDPGQNNPYRAGTDQGTYTVRLVFGRRPDGSRARNTLYTDGEVNVGLLYRIYYPNDPDNLPGGPVNPVLPDIAVNGANWSSCPPRPILAEEATLSGRLDNIDYNGTPPFPALPLLLSWFVGNPLGAFFPSQDNSYMSVSISREFFYPPFNLYDMTVLRMKTPTFTDTQNGIPPYAPANVRYWSICVNELITTSVVRCVPDNKAETRNGFATFVISDPSKRPSDDILAKWGATWIPMGALLPTDVIYDLGGNPLTSQQGVFFYGFILYRQTLADPNFAQSIENVAKLPFWLQRGAMGDYWPQIAYCTSAGFKRLGAGCMGN